MADMLDERSAGAGPAGADDGAPYFRLVAADLDGTMLRSDGTIAERTRHVVRLAAESGVVLCLATSRRFTGAEPVASALALTGPLILYDGAQIRAYPDGEELASRRLEADVAELAAAAMLGCGLRPIAQHADERGEALVVWPAHADGGAEADYLTRFAHQIVEETADLRSLAGAGPIRLVAFGDYERLKAAAQSLAHLPCAWQLLPGGNYGAAELTVFDADTSKGSALQWLAVRLGIPISRTLAIGDGINDVTLLSAAGFAVAMGNADPGTREVADVVTATNDQDGVAVALERYVLDGAGCAARTQVNGHAKGETTGT